MAHRIPEVSMSFSSLLLAVGLLLGATTVQGAEAKALKVYISADMEGVGGVVTPYQVDRKQEEWERFRKFMTQEVLAAIDGAREAGATQFVVSDSHGSMENILIEDLPEGTRLVRARPRPLGMMEGLDASFGAVVFIGYHAAANTESAVMAHTIRGAVGIRDLRINGVSVPEGGWNAAIAGQFGVPVVAISGDQAVCKQVSDLLGPIETAVVKQASGIYSATVMPPAESQKLIRERVKAGVAKAASLKPYVVKTPVTVEIEMGTTADAEIWSWMPGFTRSRNTVRYAGKDMVEAARIFGVIVNANRYEAY
jgi:D-amino peptidase